MLTQVLICVNSSNMHSFSHRLFVLKSEKITIFILIFTRDVTSQNLADVNINLKTPPTFLYESLPCLWRYNRAR